jgi:hypothetical protein
VKRSQGSAVPDRERDWSPLHRVHISTNRPEGGLPFVLSYAKLKVGDQSTIGSLSLRGVTERPDARKGTLPQQALHHLKVKLAR